MDENMIPSFLNSAVMPYEDYDQKPRMMWLLPMPGWGSSEEEQYQRQGIRDVWSSIHHQRLPHPRSWSLGNGARLWEIPVSSGLRARRGEQVQRAEEQAVSRCHRELQTGLSLERIPRNLPAPPPDDSSVPECSQWVPPQCPAQVQNQYQSQCPLARTIVREHQPPELEAHEKRGDSYADDRDVDSDRQDTHFAPRGYRFIPSFVVLSKRLNWDFFPKFVLYFLDNRRWPTFSDTPREFQDYCANYGVGRDSYEYLPGFAPEWVFHLRIMDEQWFWKVVHYFFQEREFPCWKLIPRKFETWFKELKLGEFDYPDKKNKYERLPKKIKERFGNFLEHRLRLTKRKFPKPKFPIRLDET